MKRDIKVNYGILSSIVSDLKQYNEAIESIDGLLININKKLENENDGKAIEALRNKYDKLKVQIDSCKEETKDLYNIFNNYINDMTDIIKPIDEQKMMRVSRNDIYFNKVSIGNACDNIGSIMSGILTSLGSAGTLLTSGTKIKNNIVKMYAISSLAKATSQSLQNDMDDINKLYNENVISYENMDDTYKNKASELYDKYSSVWEKFTTTVGGIGKASVDIVKGFFSSLVGLVKGVFDILKAAVVYIGAGIGAISEKITGDAPDCLKSCERKVKEYNKTIVEIVKDPFSLIEGLSQTLNDTYEEKGIAYMGGYVVGEVAQVLLLKKVSGAKSAKGIDGVEDAAKTVKNVDKAEDGSKIAKESSAIKGVSKATDYGKYSTIIDDKVKVIDKVDLPEWIGESFTDGNYRTVVTEQNITFYRTYGGGAKVDGSFVTTTPAGNRINAKINTALVPEWKNSRQYEAVIEVPKGTTINIGRVEKQYTKTGALLEGNGDQILLPQGWSSEWIKEIREVPSR